MKSFLIFSALIALGLSSCRTRPPEDINYLLLNYDKRDHINGMTPNRLRNLKGHVKSVTQYVYPLVVAADGTATREALIQGTPVYTLQFTKEGKIFEEWGYKKEDVPSYKVYYRDHFSNKIDSVVHKIDSVVHENDNVVHENEHGVVTSREVYVYDKNGIVTGGFQMYDNKTVPKVTKTETSGDTLIVHENWARLYYINGLRVKLVIGNGRRWHEDKYYPSGVRSESVIHDNGTVNMIERFDEAGNLLYLLVAEYKDGIVNYSNERIMTYENDLRVMEIQNHFDEPHRWSDTMTYIYSNGRRVQTLKNGQPYGTDEYNEHGDVLLQKNEFYNEGFQYVSYDAQGNWTERIMLASGKPFQVELRTFEYYEK